MLANQKVCFIPPFIPWADRVQVFLLIDEGTVRRYKADLADEIEPQIIELIERAERGLEALSRKQALIQRKVCRSSLERRNHRQRV